MSTPVAQADTRLSPVSLESCYSWWVAFITLVIASLSFGAVTAVPILLKPLAGEFGTGAGAVALVHTSAMVGGGLGSLIFGRLMDRFGFFKISVLAAASTGLGLLLASAADDLLTLHLAFGVLIGGIGQGAFFSPLAAAVSQWFDRHRTLAIAIAASGQSVGGLLIPPLLRSTADDFGWRVALQGYGIVAGALLLACAFAFRRLPPSLVLVPIARQQFHVHSASGFPWFAILGLSMALFNLACFMVIGHLIAFGEEQGFPPAAAASMVSAMLGIALVSRLLLGPMSQRWGRYKVLLLVSALNLVGLLLLPMAKGYGWIVAAVLLVGLGFGGYVPAYGALVRELFPATQAGRRISEIYFWAFMAAGAGSWSAGWLRDLSGSYSLAFTVGALSACAGMVILVSLRRRLGSV